MIYKLLLWEMAEADQGYEGQPKKIQVKYEHGVSKNKFDVKTRAGHMEKQSMDCSRIFGY